jgi:hypothetical protein
MKKNAMLKIAAILMVAVLLTTCAISSTFAKYTTAAEDDVTARVAKFGVTVTANVDDLFATSYTDPRGDAADVNAETITTGEGEQAISVTDNVVAPGTAKSFNTGIVVTGKPEVAVQVTTVANLTLTGWTVGGAEYCPLVFTVGTGTYKIDGTAIKTVAELETAVENAIAAYTAIYAPNTDLSTAATDNFVIGWSWAFEVLDSDGDVDAAIDVKDTALGDAATASVSLTLKQTITQVDYYDAPETESASASN